jgi:predicted  nucleic acid-binding Zn-ribbon protein
MEYYIKCTGPQSAVCIQCGSVLNVSNDKMIGRCGRCGCTVNVEYAEKVVVKEDAPKKKEWVQMTLFSE